jgi:predicted acetyltransferase
MLQDAKLEGLRFVEIVTNSDNVASCRVIESNGGRLVEELVKPPAYGGVSALRYRVMLQESAA